MHALRQLARYTSFPILMFGSLIAALTLLEQGVAPAIMPFYIVPPITVAIIALERFIPFEPHWNDDHGDLRADILHSLLSTIAASELYKFLLILALSPLAAYFATELGTELWPSSWPLLLQLLLALVLSELGQYWAHRLAHERETLWRLHAVHHSPRRLYWLNAGRDHPLGVLLVFSAQIIPLILLGATPEVFALLALYISVHGLQQHCNADLRLGPLNYFFSCCELHRWHHDLDIKKANHNYGANIIIWDLVFGSFYYPDATPSGQVGIGDMPNFPTSFLQQLAVPFRWNQLKQDCHGDVPPTHTSTRDPEQPQTLNTNTQHEALQPGTPSP